MYYDGNLRAKQLTQDRIGKTILSERTLFWLGSFKGILPAHAWQTRQGSRARGRAYPEESSGLRSRKLAGTQGLLFGGMFETGLGISPPDR